MDVEKRSIGIILLRERTHLQGAVIDMKEVIILIGIVVFWFALQAYILPKLGIST